MPPLNYCRFYNTASLSSEPFNTSPGHRDALKQWSPTAINHPQHGAAANEKLPPVKVNTDASLYMLRCADNGARNISSIADVRHTGGLDVGPLMYHQQLAATEQLLPKCCLIAAHLLPLNRSATALL